MGGGPPVPRWMGGRVIGAVGRGARGPEGGRAGIEPEGRTGSEGRAGPPR